MRSVILREPLCLSIEESAPPVPQSGEILLKVCCATTCGTDLKAYLRGHPQIPMPGPFGHEYSGDVVAVGPGVTGFSVGDAVMGVHSAPCNECFWCVGGQENLCPDVMRTKVLGSFSEFLLLPANVVKQNLYPKPRGVSYQRAALLEPLACVAHAVSRIQISPSDRVLLIGSGAIAILFSAVFRRAGFTNVLAVGRSAHRVNLLNDKGIRTILADEVSSAITTETSGRGFDVSVECAGNTDAWNAAVSSVRRGGRVVLFGGCPTGSRFELETSRVHYDDLTIMSPFHFGPDDVRKAREWLLDDEFDPGPVITKEASLEDAPAIFEDLRSGRAIKVAFVP